MSYYQDRWILFKKENVWGQSITPDTFPNYLLEWSATTTENKSEEDVIGGSRDFRKVVWLEEGVVGRWVQELVSAKIFEYILGTVSTASTTSPYESTYAVASKVPSMTIYRGLAPDENGNTVSLEYYGMKVDTAELTIEDTGDVRLELNFAGKNMAVLPVTGNLPKPSIDFSQEAFAFHHSSLQITNSSGTIPCTLVGRIVVSTNNNLEAMYSTGAGTYYPVELREGALEVEGRITMRGQFNTIASTVKGRQDNTIQITLAKTGSTITITLNNVTFGELPDEISGLEPIEIELPFTARSSSSANAIQIVEVSSSSLNALAY